MKIPSAVNDIRRMLDRNSPVILTGMALVGLGGSVYLTAKGVQKAERAITHAEVEKGGDYTLTNQEKFLLTYKFYAPAAVTTLGTGACMVMATKIGLNRTAALGAAFVVAERSNEQYRDKVKELLGDTKHVKVTDAVAADQVAAMPAGSFPAITSGEQWFVDAWSGRKLVTTREKMDAAVNQVNKELLRDSYATLSDFYNEIGLDTIQESSVIGWSVDPSKTDKLIDLNYTATLKDGQAVIAFTFNKAPDATFRDGHV